MKRHIFSSVVSVALTLIMLITSVPCIFAASNETYPIVYLPDTSDIVYYSNPASNLNRKEVFNTKSQDFISSVTGILTGLVTCAVDSTSGAEKICKSVKDMFEPILCDEKGNPVNSNVGISVKYNPAVNLSSTPKYTENIKSLTDVFKTKYGSDQVFVFDYDWRLEPVECASNLKDYIDTIIKDTGAEKISVVSGGFGGIVVNSYLNKYMSHAEKKVASVVFLDTLMMGSSIIGDIMSGHIVRTVIDSVYDMKSLFDIGDVVDAYKGADVGNAFATYISQDSLGIISTAAENYLGSSNRTDLVVLIMKFIATSIITEEGFFDKLGQGYKKLLSNAEYDIYKNGLRETLRNIPGMWAMIPQENYEDSIEKLFGTKKDIDPELYEKINSYRVIQSETEDTLRKVQSAGINTNIAAGYNMQILPVTACLNEQSDGLVATRYAGVGATTGDIDKSLKLSARCEKGNHNHMEPGKCLDASTCYLPENTWFIKNHAHMDYESSTGAEFVLWLSQSSTQRTVWSNEAFPQYMQKAIIGDKVYSYSTPSDSDLNEYKYGDMNIDGYVTVEDARLALRYAVKLEDEPSDIIRAIGDVDDCGNITVEDARLILRYAVRLDKDFSAVS